MGHYIQSYFRAGVGFVVLHATVFKKFSVYLSYKLKSVSLVEKLHEYKLKKTPNVIFVLVLHVFIHNFARRFPFSVIINGKDY